MRSGNNYLTKTAGGTLAPAGANTYTGGTVIDDGTLKLENNYALGVVPSSNGLLVNGGAQLDVNGCDINVGSVGLIDGSIHSSTAAALTATSFMLLNGTINVPLDGNAAPLLKGTLGAVTLSGDNGYTGLTTLYAGQLTFIGPDAWDPILNGGGADIQDGKIVLDYNYSGGTTPAASGPAGSHRQLQRRGRGVHVRPIFSSTATNSTGLGRTDNTWYTPNQLTIARAMYGDADLNGAVGSSDLSILFTNFGRSGMTWSQGDFDYNGVVGSSDMSILFSHFGSSPTGLPPKVAGIYRLGSGETTSNSVQFVVVFSEPVTGVDTDTFTDFALAESGTTGAIASVVDSSPSHAVYMVTVNDVYGNGTLGLNLIDNDTILDTDNMPLVGNGTADGSFTGEVYTITAGPAVPSDLTATAISTTQIDLSWMDGDTSQTGYQIDKSTDGGTTWIPLATINNANTKSYSDTGLAEGTPYYYRVQAIDAVAGSDYATTAAAPLLATPTLLQFTSTGISGSAVYLQWTDNSANESGYSIQQLVDGDWQEIGWTDADATSTTVENDFPPSTETEFSGASVVELDQFRSVEHCRGRARGLAIRADRIDGRNRLGHGIRPLLVRLDWRNQLLH